MSGYYYVICYVRVEAQDRYLEKQLRLCLKRCRFTDATA